MTDLLDSVEAGKEGDVAPRGSGAGHWLFPIDLASVDDGDVLTAFVPGFKGKIISVDAYVVIPVTTASKLSTLNLEIGAVNLTGGTVALTSANCTPVGAKVAGAAVTANNEFGKGDNISIEASSTTAFVEGMIFLDVAYVVLGS